MEMGFHPLPSHPLLFTSCRLMSGVLLLLLHCSVLPPSSSSEPLEQHHVAQLLRCFSTDLSLGRHLSLDGALAHHLHLCSYHLRLFRNWLISGQEPLESLHGQPPWLRPPPPRPRAPFSRWLSRDCARCVVDSCFASRRRCMSACFCVSGFFGLFLPSAAPPPHPTPILQAVSHHSLRITGS